MSFRESVRLLPVQRSLQSVTGSRLTGWLAFSAAGEDSIEEAFTRPIPCATVSTPIRIDTSTVR